MPSGQNTPCALFRNKRSTILSCERGPYRGGNATVWTDDVPTSSTRTINRASLRIFIEGHEGAIGHHRGKRLTIRPDTGWKNSHDTCWYWQSPTIKFFNESPRFCELFREEKHDKPATEQPSDTRAGAVDRD